MSLAPHHSGTFSTGATVKKFPHSDISEIHANSDKSDTKKDSIQDWRGFGSEASKV